MAISLGEHRPRLPVPVDHEGSQVGGMRGRFGLQAKSGGQKTEERGAGRASAWPKCLAYD